MLAESQTTRRRLLAGSCLIAILFLEAPVFAALAIASGVCCTGNYCPIAAHHHAARAASSSPASEKSEPSATECGQHMQYAPSSPVARVQGCSISCCQTTERPAVHAYVFVLSSLPSIAACAPVVANVSGFDAGKTAAFFSPLSPPPKSFPSLI